MSDNEVRIDTSLNTGKVERGIKFIERGMQRLASSTVQAAKQMQMSFSKGFNTDINSQRQLNADYQSIISELNEVSNAFESAENKKREFLSNGGSVDTEYYRQLSQDSEQLYQDIIRLTQQSRELREVLGGQRSIAESLGMAFANMGEGIKTSIRSALSNIRELPSVMKSIASIGIQNALNGIQTGFQKLGVGLRKAINLFKNLKSSVNGSNKGFSGGFMKILKYTLGIRSLYILVNKLRGALVDGFKNLAQFNDGANQTNKDLSLLKSSLTQLKNSFAVAFAPILSYIVPALNSMINALSNAMNYLSMFLSFLGGKSTYTKAIKVQENYAESLDNTASSANKANKALAKFDDLDVLNNDKGGGGGGCTSPNDMFEEVPIDNDLMESMDPYELGKKFSEYLKNGLESIDWDTIKAQSEELGRNVARFLNAVWDDEELARDIGHAVAESLNTGLHFVYGFVDETNWLQVGHWLGALVQQGVDDFEWDLAGETIGKLINGFADTVIGFFERYQSGSIAESIGNMLNRAIDEYDSEKVGNAIFLMINEAIQEGISFLETVDWKEAGRKLGATFAKILTSEDENGNRLGVKVANLLIDAINAGINFLVGVDIVSAAGALGTFFGDLIGTALRDIDWKKLGIILLTSLVDATSALAGEFSKALGDVLGFDDSFFQDAIGDIQTQSNLLKESIGIVQVYASSVKDATDAMLLFTNGSTMSADELCKLQDSLGLTNEEMDGLVQAMYDANENLDDVSLGLGEYSGDWLEFRNSINQTKETITETANTTKTETDNMSNSLNNLSQNANKSTSEVKEYIKHIDDSMSESSNTAKSYADRTTEALGQVSEKTSDTSISFGRLNDDAKASLDGVSASMDEWFTQTVEPYFSQEKWQLFGENIKLAMTEAVTAFREEWTIAFDEWWLANEEMYFGYDIWYEMMQNPLTAYADAWTEFDSLWQSNITTWWSSYVEPYFTVEQWQLFGTNMRTGIMTGFKGIVSDVGGVLGKLTDCFNAQMKNIADAVNKLVDKVNKMADELGVSKLPHVNWSNVAKIQIPQLATGAVIPPNKKFLAMLGDQTHGTNIEAPLETIKQGLREVVAELGGIGGNQNAQMTLDGETFARLAIPYMLDELNRRGYDVSVLEG